MALAVRREHDPSAFAERVQPWLLEREAEHNILLGLLPKLVAGLHEFEPPVYLASIEDEGRVLGCAFRTPPYKLVVSRFPPDAAPSLTEDVRTAFDTLPAVLGREEDAARFGEAWSILTGDHHAVGMRQRIHRLDDLTPPASLAPGQLRTADAPERSLVVEWLDAFTDETGIGGSRGAALADVLLAGGHAFLWDHDGPRALVGVPGFTPNGARVGYVYTPPGERGRGYATAAVAALSRRLLASGRFCVLFTDLANPTSNGIYARLGYRPVIDVVDDVFSPPTTRR
jgi:GNAT superfamily N-acetyltransferase